MEDRDIYTESTSFISALYANYCIELEDVKLEKNKYNKDRVVYIIERTDRIDRNKKAYDYCKINKKDFYIKSVHRYNVAITELKRRSREFRAMQTLDKLIAEMRLGNEK
ncbi:hypothetical protein [Inediibacterium massiliense]|uniref:hypothetical protein n=1 Tax=Inediibacterium massiliense TaxID=1658111 RepID=UPI0006B4E52C|nr:hypothetical protein [Inediibacterium massiliense]